MPLLVYPDRARRHEAARKAGETLLVVVFAVLALVGLVGSVAALVEAVR